MKKKEFEEERPTGKKKTEGNNPQKKSTKWERQHENRRTGASSRSLCPRSSRPTTIQHPSRAHNHPPGPTIIGDILRSSLIQSLRSQQLTGLPPTSSSSRLISEISHQSILVLYWYKPDDTLVQM